MSDFNKENSNKLMKFLEEMYPGEFSEQTMECVQAICRVAVKGMANKEALAMLLAEAILTFPGWEQGPEGMDKVYYGEEEKESVH